MFQNSDVGIHWLGTLIRYHIRTRNILDRVENQAMIWFYLKYILDPSVLSLGLGQTVRNHSTQDNMFTKFW